MTSVPGAVARPTPALGTATLPPYTRRLLMWSFAIGILPPILLIVALAANSFYLLQFTHVLTGGTWTGFDLFMGIIFARLMGALDIPARVEVAKRLTPITFFILPSLAAVAITSGIYLAQLLGKFDLGSPRIIAAGIVVLILTFQGFAIFLPNGVRIFIELAKRQPDTARIARLNMRSIRLAGVQAILQVALILIMANLATS